MNSSIVLKCAKLGASLRCPPYLSGRSILVQLDRRIVSEQHLIKHAFYSSQPEAISHQSIKTADGKLSNLDMGAPDGLVLASNFSESKMMKKLLEIDSALAEMIPLFMNTKNINIEPLLSKDIVLEDKINRYDCSGLQKVLAYLIMIKFYFNLKSPSNRMEHLGSFIEEEGIYQFDGNRITVLYALNTLKGSMLTYFLPWRDNRHVIEGALEMFISQEGLIYKVLNRKVTDADREAMQRRKPEMPGEGYPSDEIKSEDK